jgi:predicted enzyme related to lactoylglutathione lyase
MPIAQPITWGDIEVATKAAVVAGAELAHPPLEIPGRGTFSIFFLCENQFGYWQD